MVVQFYTEIVPGCKQSVKDGMYNNVFICCSIIYFIFTGWIASNTTKWQQWHKCRLLPSKTKKKKKNHTQICFTLIQPIFFFIFFLTYAVQFFVHQSLQFLSTFTSITEKETGFFKYFRGPAVTLPICACFIRFEGAEAGTKIMTAAFIVDYK